jgi:hypothetical protein
MKFDPKNPSPAMSRRKMLQVGVGVAATLGITAAAANAQVARKASQKDAGYQDSPSGAKSCGNCANFVAPSSCRSVEGTVSPNGWCRIYAKKG